MFEEINTYMFLFIFLNVYTLYSNSAKVSESATQGLNMRAIKNKDTPNSSQIQIFYYFEY